MEAGSSDISVPELHELVLLLKFKLQNKEKNVMVR